MKRSVVASFIAASILLLDTTVPAAYQPNQKTIIEAVKEESRMVPGGKPPSLKIGDNAWTHAGPTLPALDGNSYSLEHWKGKVILLNFWASWCAPCQYEIPELVRMQQRYADKGLQVIGIGLDKEAPLRNVSRSLGINYPVLIAEGSRGNAMLEHWGDDRQVVPYNAVINRDGEISFLLLGKFDQEVFDDIVAPLLD